jgi:Tfp pilus assembly protein PilX
MNELRMRLDAVRGDDGYVMVVVIGVLLVATLFSVAALAAADRDVPQSRQDVDRKGALQAAEAGLNYYLYHLNEDNGFWAQCADVEEAGQPEAPVNQPWNRVAPDPRVWRNVPGSPDTQYTVELLPAKGAVCDKNDPAGTMINASNGTFRIRTTGRSSANRQGTYTYRTIVTTFRRNGFLDYLYFTNYETSPPSAYSAYGTNSTLQSVQAWAATACARWWREDRNSQTTLVDADNDGSKDDTLRCNQIQFAGNDVVNGPMHTNDNILVCGTPKFGRLTDALGNPARDKIEVSDPNPPGYRNNGCTGSPTVRPTGNTLKTGATELTLPPSNGSLSTIAKPAYVFTGETTIRLNGSTLTVTDHSGAGGAANGPRTMSWPDNGVIYVKQGTCAAGGYNLYAPYNVPTGCAIAHVSGDYSKSLTIASARDIVVHPLASDPDNSGVVRNAGADAMLGLIADDHVRVYHDVKNLVQNGLNWTCDEVSPSTGSKPNIRIDAAILALHYSFIVDNYYCGDPLQKLTVNGVIAQMFRGPVGTGNGTTNASGYVKNYAYDDRLVYRSPPYFLDPVQSAWQVVRYNELIPAVK